MKFHRPFRHPIRSILCLAFGLCSVFPTFVQGAPIPLIASQNFRLATNGAFFSKSGFSIHAGRSGWTKASPPTKNPFIETVFISDDDTNIQASLTVRLDQNNKSPYLDQYAKRWMNDYPRFGFNVLAAKKVRVGKNTAFLMELVNRESSKQLRQVLFVRGKSAVTLTCRDDVKSFMQSIKSCNEIIRTFQWY